MSERAPSTALQRSLQFVKRPIVLSLGGTGERLVEIRFAVALAAADDADIPAVEIDLQDGLREIVVAPFLAAVFFLSVSSADAVTRSDVSGTIAPRKQCWMFLLWSNCSPNTSIGDGSSTTKSNP
jgi:hypothetical protein